MPELSLDEAKRLFDIANTGDAGRVLAECTDNVTFPGIMMPEPISGKKALGEFLRTAFAAFPDQRGQQKSVAVHRNEIFAVEHVTRTHSGPLTLPV